MARRLSQAQEDHLNELAAWARGKEIEDELVVLHARAPQIFLSRTPPQLLRPHPYSLPAITANGHRLGRPPKDDAAVPVRRTGRKRSYNRAQWRATRLRSQKLLDALGSFEDGATTEALAKKIGDPQAAKRLSVLIQHGFIKKNGKVYTRTAKPFRA